MSPSAVVPKLSIRCSLSQKSWIVALARTYFEGNISKFVLSSCYTGDKDLKLRRSASGGVRIAKFVASNPRLAEKIADGGKPIDRLNSAEILELLIEISEEENS